MRLHLRDLQSQLSMSHSPQQVHLRPCLGTAFSTTIDDVSYQFVTIADTTATNFGGL